MSNGYLHVIYCSNKGLSTWWHLLCSFLCTNFWATVCKTVRPMLSDRCLSVLSWVTFVHCGQMVGQIKMKLGMQAGLGPGHIVLGLDGDPAPLLQRAQPHSIFGPCCGQMAAWIKVPLGMELGLSPGDFVLYGDPALPSLKKGAWATPNFRPISVVAKRLHASRYHLVWR